MLERLGAKSYQIRCIGHAAAILEVDFPDALRDIESVLAPLSIPLEELVRGGGGETRATQRIRKGFAARGWTKRIFEIRKFINDKPKQSTSHQVDHVRDLPAGAIALEIEWNNKDPFFDRDLENFGRLHAEGAISVGAIVTRGESLQGGIGQMVQDYARRKALRSFDDVARCGLSPTPRQQAAVRRRLKPGPTGFADAWAAQLCADKFGQATTHWQKLMDRVARGVGNPCPLLLVGIPGAVVER